MTTLEDMENYLRNQPENLTPPEPTEPLEEIPQYRFKTEQEFIEEFGKGWKHQWKNYSLPNIYNLVEVDWTDEMGFLFGEILEPEISETIYRNPSAQIKIDGWIISKEMITDKPLK
jgi:hypothetical protein